VAVRRQATEREGPTRCALQQITVFTARRTDSWNMIVVSRELGLRLKEPIVERTDQRHALYCIFGEDVASLRGLLNCRQARSESKEEQEQSHHEAELPNEPNRDADDNY
jgi:hypothetical protein